MKRGRSQESAQASKAAKKGPSALNSPPLSTPLEYLHGIGGGRSEAKPNAIPKGQNNPQRCPYDLYAEKLSGTAFTAPRHKNMQTWLYRIRPSVQHVPYKPCQDGARLMSNFDVKDGTIKADPNQIRWMPTPLPSAPTTFVSGLYTIGGSGSPESYTGFAIHNYACNASMEDSCFINSDGDFLIVPQEGALRVVTELGVMDVQPAEICVVQRGIRFAVQVAGPSRGYILEVFCRHFSLPELGPIGSYGLANAQDFRQPSAAFEDRDVPTGYRVINKFCGELFEAAQSFSPFNVVAWTGTYVPFKYDLRKFMCINSVTYDHPDPSIYTVLTCPSDEPGVAVADFVIFPPRWMPQEHTFRPPWYHRNCMSEYMGMIWGQYDAKLSDKKDSGFVPGGGTIHNWMTPHGPDEAAFSGATAADLQPHFFDKGLAFMFESKYAMKLTSQALEAPFRDHEYYKCWESLPKRFSDWVPEDGEDLVTWRANKTK